MYGCACFCCTDLGQILSEVPLTLGPLSDDYVINFTLPDDGIVEETQMLVIILSSQDTSVTLPAPQTELLFADDDGEIITF